MIARAVWTGAAVLTLLGIMLIKLRQPRWGTGLLAAALGLFTTLIVWQAAVHA